MAFIIFGLFVFLGASFAVLTEWLEERRKEKAMNDCGKCVFEDRSVLESPCRECLDMAVYQDIENACFRPVNEEEEAADE